MKKITCLFFAFLLLLCGCSQSIPEQPAGVGSFSYKSDRAYYANFRDDPGIKESGFVNVKRSKVNSAEDAVALAKKECKVEYDTIDVAFDPETKMYRVSFYKGGNEGIYTVGGDQQIYIDQNGITKLIISRE